MSDSIFLLVDDSLVRVVSQPAWRRAGWLGAAVALPPLVLGLLRLAPIPLAVGAALAYWAWRVLHNTKHVTVFDRAAREVWFGSCRWLYWKPEPAPERTRSIDFARLREVGVDSVADEDGWLTYELAVHLTDGERIFLAIRERQETMQASARMLRDHLWPPR